MRMDCEEHVWREGDRFIGVKLDGTSGRGLRRQQQRRADQTRRARQVGGGTTSTTCAGEEGEKEEATGVAVRGGETTPMAMTRREVKVVGAGIQP